jgi:hypothetical protein
VSMSEKHSDRSVSGSSDDIRLRKDGVYIVAGEGTLVRVAPPILVTAFATSNPNTARESAFTEIKFENRRGKWRKEIVPASLLTAQSEQFIKLLSERGYLLPPKRAGPKEPLDRSTSNRPTGRVPA